MKTFNLSLLIFLLILIVINTNGELISLTDGLWSTAFSTDSKSEDYRFGPGSARLNTFNAWCSLEGAAPGCYLQIDFGEEKEIVAVGTKGRESGDQWVTEYKLVYSTDGVTFESYPQPLYGNTDRNNEVINPLQSLIRARYLQFYPVYMFDIKKANIACMRVEAYGGTVPDTLPSQSPTREPTNPPEPEGYHWIVAGDGAFLDTKPLECASNLQINGIHSNSFGNKIGVRCCDVNGAGSSPGCLSGKTYNEAFQICNSMGRTLCTIEQLKNGAAARTGCSFDSYHCWTSNLCDPQCMTSEYIEAAKSAESTDISIISEYYIDVLVNALASVIMNAFMILLCYGCCCILYKKQTKSSKKYISVYKDDHDADHQNI